MRHALIRYAVVAPVSAAMLAVLPGCAARDRERNENEVEVMLDEVPPAVRETITRESGGAPVGAIMRETENGRTVYEAKISKGGKTWEVEVDESGKVLEREKAD